MSAEGELNMGPIETLVVTGFELEAATELGIALEPRFEGFDLTWTSSICGACAAAVDSVAEAREWIRANWRLFAPKGA